jgi:hypothetical protein
MSPLAQCSLAWYVPHPIASVFAALAPVPWVSEVFCGELDGRLQVRME